MKKIYISYDVVGDEIIDAFVRKNNAAAVRDFKLAFMRQGKDSTHVKLFQAYPEVSDGIIFDDVEGLPVKELWDSESFEENEQSEKTEN